MLVELHVCSEFLLEGKWSTLLLVPVEREKGETCIGGGWGVSSVRWGEPAVLG
jgi:hypothetical protein